MKTLYERDDNIQLMRKKLYLNKISARQISKSLLQLLRS